MADTLRDRMLDAPETARSRLAKRLEGIAWGLFFIWVGIAFLADVGWATGFLGVAAITLGAQVARKYLGLPVERFWVIMGIVFAAWGGLMALDVRFREASIPGDAMPMAFIVVGIVLVAFALLGKR